MFVISYIYFQLVSNLFLKIYKKMLKINFEILFNIKNFKLLTARHSSFYQLRINIFNQLNHKKTCQQVIPYLILTPQKQILTQSLLKQNNKQKQKLQYDSLNNNNNKNQSQIFKKKQSLQNKNINYLSSSQLQNKQKNYSQIDSQTNSFLSKPFLVRQIDHFLPIDQIIIFKGHFQINSNQLQNTIFNNNLQNHINNINQINKLYVNCQLFLVNSFTSQSIGQWYGYTLADQGTVALPMSFFSYNSSYAQTQITFLWTSIQFTQDNNPTKHLSDTKISNLTQFIQSKFTYLTNKILIFPQQYKTKKYQMKTTSTNPLKTLNQTITQYNQQIYDLWKHYQQYQQKTITSLINGSTQLFNQKLKNYQQALAQYHWKNHIIVTEEIQPEKQLKQKQLQQNNQDNFKQSLYQQEMKNKKMPAQLAKLKKDPKIDSNLVFYPFQKHQRMIKLANQDFKKIASISSMSIKFSNKFQTHNQKIHLLIFVHGYQASGFDMQNLAAFFKYKQPNKIKTFVSTCNEGRTEQPMQQSGHRLAIQIKNYINNKFDHQDFDISFVCHSMGGLITRAALKYLQLYKNKFKTFLSLCSPHLGYLYHTSTLVKTSLWVLNQVKKDPSMIQLTMQDNSSLQKTFLYQLSQKSELSWFKYPIFIGSRQDEYIPFWSALVRDKDFFFDTKQAKTYKMLYKNLTQKIQPNIIRLEAIYKVKINDISSFVGRTAHIRILNCIQVMQMIYLLTQKAF